MKNFQQKKKVSQFFSMKWVFTEQHCCEYSLLWLPRKTSQEALGWAGQTLDLGWVAQLLASRHPAFTEASKGLAAEESGDHTFSHCLLRSSRHIWAPSKRKTNECLPGPSPVLGKEKHKPLSLLEDERAKTCHLYGLESSEVCVHSGLSSTFFGVLLRIAQLLHKDELCHNRRHHHPQEGLIMTQGSEELEMTRSFRNPNTNPLSKVKCSHLHHSVRKRPVEGAEDRWAGLREVCDPRPHHC